MTRIDLSRVGPIAMMAGLLGSLAIGAPVYNAQHTAPRSVFLSLPAEIAEPSVTLSAERRASGRWVLRIDAVGFQFTQICLTEADPIPVGHAHIIVDGVKVASAYHPIIELGALPPGRHRVRAILRGQDHRALLGERGLIGAEVIIDVQRQGNQI